MSLQRGVCSCAELQVILLLQRLKGSMSGDARDFNNIETRAVIKVFFFLQGKAPKEIHVFLTETLDRMANQQMNTKFFMAKSFSASSRWIREELIENIFR
jgi:hypothetical protein